MAVPARPTSGAPIDSTWGGIAHDAAVAQDIQTGIIVVTTAGGVGGSAILTFPRPFASAPSVMLCPSAAYTDTIQATADNHTATTCRVGVKTPTNYGWSVRWIAVGPRA